MDKLKSMQVFVDVVQRGSLSRSAAHFSVTSTMIGKHVKSLESHLGTKLLHRTTRKQSLTEAGQAYYLECTRILDEIEEAENSLQSLTNKPKGTIRINSPVTYGNLVVAPIVSDFLLQFPDINVELTLDNNLIDPMHDQVDVVIRIGELADSSIIARKVDEYEMLFCATPDYLEQHGTPQSLGELASHQCLGFSYGDIQTNLALRIDTSAFDRQFTRLSSNSGQALKTAALRNTGIILQPRLLVAEELKQGALCAILEKSTPPPSPIHLLYKGKSQPLKIRTFIDFFLDALQ
ncbi:LysR family transcriptional regulator [Photobacterium sp. SDRW27]|uniref:LysR family transcriptional regulator n=1 Tax=Photobacterium obscurum TaxID=2829490 RepID=UPI00224397EB|nr:LysR family transcriptional regulator [Photobacterium obscurum]MCW8328957.1 LysR family transcriptional regulator [Photobacterium obscurum]